jgi:hypothetical protein
MYFIYINEAGKIFGLNQVLGPKIAAVEEELLRTPVIAPGQRGANPVPVRMVVEIRPNGIYRANTNHFSRFC